MKEDGPDLDRRAGKPIFMLKRFAWAAMLSVNAAIARVSNRAPAADFSVNDWLSRSEAMIADLRLVLEEVKATFLRRRAVEVW